MYCSLLSVVQLSAAYLCQGLLVQVLKENCYEVSLVCPDCVNL